MERSSGDICSRRHDCGVTVVVTELRGVFHLSARSTGAPTLVGRMARDIAGAQVEGDRLIAVHFAHACSDRCGAWTYLGVRTSDGSMTESAEALNREVASPVSHVEDHLLHRIKSEFLEMPGLRLTKPQAKRLWGLDDVSCSALLAALVDSQFLFQTRDGAFMRIERARAKAGLATSVTERPAVA